MQIHAALTGVAIATSVTLGLLGPTFAPKVCRWCDRDEQGNDTLNGFDRSIRDALRWQNTHKADVYSTAFSFVLAPVAGVALGSLIAVHDGRGSELPADLLVVAEAASFALVLNDVAKLGFARERPYVHARTPAERAELESPSDNVSFYSGHATLAFSLAVSAGTVASMRHHRLAPLMWATGLVFASAGAYLRIAADKHYATDVLTGALVGSAIGFSVPYFLHSKRGARLSVVPMPKGIGVVGVF